MAKKLLCAIDCQYDFIMSDGKLPVPNAENIIVPGIKFLSKLDPDEYKGVFWTYDTHSDKEYVVSEEAKQFPIHCEKGTSGWTSVFSEDLVHSHIEEYVLYKDVFNMWNPEVDYEVYEGVFDHHRDSFFESLKNEGVDTIQIFGVALNICVKYAVLGFVERGFKVELIEHLCRGIDTGKGPYDLNPHYLFEKEIELEKLIII